jgi:putative endonuclease
MHKYFVYIMASKSRTLYVGVTSDLETRLIQHQCKLIPGFTKKYNISRLVWFDDFDDIDQAIEGEKKIKGWRRSKKIALIESKNPQWLGLAELPPKLDGSCQSERSEESQSPRRDPSGALLPQDDTTKDHSDDET